MIVSVFRHGEAADAARDSERKLSSRGESDIALAAQAFAEACSSDSSHRLGVPQIILHSPYERTRRTAQILSGQFPSIEMNAIPALQPEGGVEDVESVLESLAKNDVAHVLLVSHQPLVSYLANHWVNGAERIPGMMPGAFTSIAMETIGAQCAQLLFWATPPTYALNQ